MSNYPKSGPDGTIPVDDAITWTKNWRTFLEISGQDFIIRSFQIPIIDLSNILLYNPKAEAVRAYIGLEDAKDPLSAKLILVPVVDGHDVPVVPSENGGLGADGQSNTYDVTKACPPQCPDGSVLDE